MKFRVHVQCLHLTNGTEPLITTELPAEDWGVTSSSSMELTTLLLWTIFQEIVKFSSITSDANHTIIKAYKENFYLLDMEFWK
jgi:hypothetical protein